MNTNSKRWLALGLVVVMLLLLVGCGGKVMDVSSAITVSFSGVNGEGTAKADLDISAVEAVIMEDYDPNTQEGLTALLALETAIEEAVSYTVDKTDGLSNGDEVTVSIKYDNEVMKRLKNYNVTLDGPAEKKFTVSGLTDVVEIDPFDPAFFNTDTEDGVNIVITGVYPNNFVNIENNLPDDDPLHYLHYVVLPSEGVANGSSITVKASIPFGRDMDDCKLKTDETTVKIGPVNEFVSSPAQVSDEVLDLVKAHADEMFEAAHDSIFHTVSVHKDDDSTFKLGYNADLTNFKFNKIYVLTPKAGVDSSSAGYASIAYVTYKVDTTAGSDQPASDSADAEYKGLNGAFRINNLAVSPDGKNGLASNDTELREMEGEMAIEDIDCYTNPTELVMFEINNQGDLYDTQEKTIG